MATKPVKWELNTDEWDKFIGSADGEMVGAHLPTDRSTARRQTWNVAGLADSLIRWVLDRLHVRRG